MWNGGDLCCRNIFSFLFLVKSVKIHLPFWSPSHEDRYWRTQNSKLGRQLTQRHKHHRKHSWSIWLEKQSQSSWGSLDSWPDYLDSTLYRQKRAEIGTLFKPKTQNLQKWKRTRTTNSNQTAEHWHWDGKILKQINATTAETSDPITPYQRTWTSPSVMVRPNQDEESEEGAQRESSHCWDKHEIAWSTSNLILVW